MSLRFTSPLSSINPHTLALQCKSWRFYSTIIGSYVHTIDNPEIFEQPCYLSPMRYLSDYRMGMYLMIFFAIFGMMIRAHLHWVYISVGFSTIHGKMINRLVLYVLYLLDLDLVHRAQELLVMKENDYIPTGRLNCCRDFTRLEPFLQNGILSMP